MMNFISEFSVPLIVSAILLFGFVCRCEVFDLFLDGAKDGIKTAFDIIPALVALMTAVGVFSASGALDLLTTTLSPITERFAFPSELIPLALLRPISGSGSLAIFQDILARFGPDSFIGRCASVMEGSTETTFYTIAVYYGAIGIKKTRHTVFASLAADLTGFVMSVLCVRVLMGGLPPAA